MGDPNRLDRLKEILLEAKALEGEARAAYLDRACAGDAELRSEAESLLGHDHDIGSADAVSQVRGSFLAEDEAGTSPNPIPPSGDNADASNSGRSSSPLASPTPDGMEFGDAEKLDRYYLLRILGEGGMGVVYEAEQTEPIRRRVALKRVRTGLAGARAVQRFQSERQALALMDHPGISRVLDAGADAEGRPFFVMELVDGIPITRHCEENALPLADRLRLFMLVCEAVQHAHQKGVIHRDLKPTNVLVTMQSGRAQPKVIDFGIAKAVAPEIGYHDEAGAEDRPSPETGESPADDRAGLRSRTGSPSLDPSQAATRAGELVGTPEYMSPEQASGRSGSIDARTDIYALGMLLYELLVGQLPFPAERFRSANVSEILRIVREEQPTRPSQRLEELEAGTHRHDGRPRPARLPRDLDWIVLRALAKEPTERYASASELAADIDRFLGKRPVEAAPQSEVYRLRRFAERHRFLLTGSALLVIALLSGVIGTAWQARRAHEERARAERSLGRIRDLSQEFLFGVYDQVTTLPGSTPVREYIVEEATAVLAEIADDPRDARGVQEPLIAAYTRLGIVQVDLGRQEEARQSLTEGIRLAEAALVRNPGDPRLQELLANALDQMGRIFNISGDVETALEFHQRALTLQRALAEAHPDSSRYRAAISNDLVRTGFNLVRTGRAADALPLYEEAIELNEGLGDVLRPDQIAFPWAFRGECLEDLGRPQEALASYVRANQVFEQASREDPGNALYRNRLAVTLGAIGSVESELGRTEEAISTLERSLRLRQQLSVEDPENMIALRDLAKGWLQLGRTERDAGDLLGAQRSFVSGREIVEELAEDSTDAGAARYLSQLIQAEASVQHLTGDSAAARGLLLRSIEIDDRLVDAEPERDDHHFRRLESHEDLFTWAMAEAELDGTPSKWRAVRRWARAGLSGLAAMEAQDFVGEDEEALRRRFEAGLARADSILVE